MFVEVLYCSTYYSLLLTTRPDVDFIVSGSWLTLSATSATGWCGLVDQVSLLRFVGQCTENLLSTCQCSLLSLSERIYCSYSGCFLRAPALHWLWMTGRKPPDGRPRKPGFQDPVATPANRRIILTLLYTHSHFYVLCNRVFHDKLLLAAVLRGFLNTLSVTVLIATYRTTLKLLMYGRTGNCIKTLTVLQLFFTCVV